MYTPCNEDTSYYIYECVTDMRQRAAYTLWMDSFAVCPLRQRLTVVMMHLDSHLAGRLFEGRHQVFLAEADDDILAKADVLIVNTPMDTYQNGIIDPIKLIAKYHFPRVIWVVDNRYRDANVLHSLREQKWILSDCENTPASVAFLRYCFGVSEYDNQQHVVICQNHYPQIETQMVNDRAIAYHVGANDTSGCYYNDIHYTPRPFTLHDESLYAQVCSRVVNEIGVDLQVSQVDEK